MNKINLEIKTDAIIITLGIIMLLITIMYGIATMFVQIIWIMIAILAHIRLIIGDR